MLTFYRGSFTDVVVTLTSSETLGLLDTDYLEDYFGTDGQVSARHLETDTRYPIPMSVVASFSPDTPFDRFEGSLPLAAIPNGDYVIEGRCRDLLSKFTTIGDSVNQQAGDLVQVLAFRVANSEDIPGLITAIVKRKPALAVVCKGGATVTVCRTPAIARLGKGC